MKRFKAAGVTLRRAGGGEQTTLERRGGRGGRAMWEMVRGTGGLAEGGKQGHKSSEAGRKRAECKRRVDVL